MIEFFRNTAGAAGNTSRLTKPAQRFALSSLVVTLLAIGAGTPVLAAEADAAAVYAIEVPAAKIASTLLLDVASAGSRLVAVGQRGHIIFSDDQGKTWTQAKVPTRALLTAIYFVDATHG